MRFSHRAVFNDRLARVEISLVSQAPQSVSVGPRMFAFDPGEPILTEYSHKYTIEGFAAMAAEAGLTLRKTWTDARRRFAVLHFALLTDGDR
jgi:uncharacterized SAM-dependent methyltransferase